MEWSDVWGCIAVGIIIGGGWAGWIAWELTSRKSVGTVFGLVVVCLFLSWLSYVCHQAISIFVLSILAAPFVVVYMVGFLGLRLLLLVLSPLFVFNIRPFSNTIEKPQICRLCDKCDAMIDGSKHLTGSPWIMIRSVEKHEFYTRSELEISSTKCHLCQLLYKSVTTFGEEGRVITETTNTSGQSEALKLTAISTTQNIKNSPNNTQLTVKIWLPKYWLKKCVLHIQLCGPNIAESKRLDVAWKVIGELYPTVSYPD